MKKIVAHFQLGQIVEGHPENLWEQFHDVSGIGEEEFFRYFAGRDTGFAIQIEDLMQYQKPIDPNVFFENFVPPQSFCYIDQPLEYVDFKKMHNRK
jgi:predicted transcriptional regulator